MSEVNHVCLVEVLEISTHDKSIFEENGPCTNTLVHLPVHSISLDGSWPWVMVGNLIFICVKVISVGVNKLSLKFAL